MNSYALNLSISYGFTGATFLLLAWFTISRDSQNPINQKFGLYCAVISLWSLFSIPVLNTINYTIASTFMKACLIGAIFIPSTFYDFIIHFLKIKTKIWHQLKVLIYGFSFFLLGILYFTPLFISYPKGAYKLHYFSNPDIGYHTFLVFFFLIITLCLIVLFYSVVNETDPLEKRRKSYLLFSTIFGYLGGSLNYSLTYNLGFYELIPYGNYAVCIYGMIIAYTIVKYQLLDINVILRKGLFYSVFISMMTVLIVLFVYIIEKAFQSILGYQSFFTSILLATLVCLIFIPLRNATQNLIDKIFFQGSIPEIAEQNELLRSEVSQAEKHKAIATLSSSIAHEVRNPLTALKTFIEYYPKKKDDPVFMEKFHDVADREIGRIEGLVQQLLNFAKPSPPEFQQINLCALIEETLMLVESDLHKNNIILEKTLPNEAVLMNADPNQMKQALLNIIRNAIEAMPHGGSLRVDLLKEGSTSSENSPCHNVSMSPCLNKILLTIKDTGTGIPKEKLKQIFDPFYTSKPSGTGLGMAITKDIIEKHGGKIVVESDVNAGTTFKILLKETT